MVVNFVGHKEYLHGLLDEGAMYARLDMLMTLGRRMQIGFYMCQLGTAVELDGCGVERYLPLVKSAYDSVTGGFGADAGAPPQLASTTYALAMLRRWKMLPPPTEIRKIISKGESIIVEGVDILKVAQYLHSLRRRDGQKLYWASDAEGEGSSESQVLAVVALSILGQIDVDAQDAIDAAEWTMSCQNIWDKAFGDSPGAESHAAFTYCSLATLSLLGKLDTLVSENCRRQLSEWLARRQGPSGGFSGRPEKTPDVCYSWWILASLSLLKSTSYVNLGEMTKFIIKCEAEGGGISDRPGNAPDVFHTFYGIAAADLITGRIMLDPRTAFDFDCTV